jgi:diguanylate cyclase (GGDEF)-like protein
MIDLNDFKLVNDRHGHHAGDELLIRVAERLTGCLRTTDTVARLGGDEFAVLIEDEPDAAALAAGRVRDAFGPVFVVDGRPLRVTASIGLACTAGHAVEVTAESLLKDADLAMYAVKREHATTEPPSRRTGHPSGTAQSPPARRPAAPRRPV